MKKALKFILSFISLIIIAMVSVPILLSMLLQVSVIQNYAVRVVTQKLSEKAQTTMSISHIDIEFFSNVVIDDVYIEGPLKDSMIYVKQLKVGIDGINFLNGRISLGVVDVTGGACNLYTDSLNVMNVQRVFDHFAAEKPDPNPPNFRMSARELNLRDFHFSLYDVDAQRKANGINFQNMIFKKIQFQARDINIFNYEISLAIERLTFHDRSGFYLQHLSSAQCGVNRDGMRFEKLRIETSESLLQFNHLYLLYDTWYAYNNFVQDVTIDADIAPSRLSYRTLSYFISQPPAIATTVGFQGRVRGTVPNLHGYLTDISTHNTNFDVAFSIVGLPDISKTKFNAALDNLTTSGGDVESIYGEITGKSLESIAPYLQRSGDIKVNGTFEGMLTDYLATATLSTKQGKLSASINVLQPSITNARFKGRLSSEAFGLGELLAVRDLGQIVFDANVDVTVSDKAESQIVTKAEVAKVTFAGYDYTGIEVDGKFVGKTYNGIVTSSDPNCDFTANGLFDLTKDVPSYNFSMNMNRADLVALGFNKRDSISVLAANFAAVGTGTKLDDINGETSIDKIVYINQLDTVKTGAIKIFSDNSDRVKSMTLLSDFADIQLSGTNSYSEIFRYLAQSARKYIPSMPDAEAIITNVRTPHKLKASTPIKAYSPGSYTLNAQIKKANNVASIFLPGMEIDEGTRLEFMFDPLLDQFRLLLNSNYIALGKESLQKLSLRSYNSADSIILALNSDVCEAMGLYMPNFKIGGSIQSNNIDLNLDFENQLDSTGAHLRTTTSIYRTEQDMPQIKVAINSAQVTLEGQSWAITPCHALLDSTGVTIRNFNISADGQYLNVNGRLGRQSSDSIEVNMANFDISPVSALVSSLGYQLSGKLSGFAKGYSMFNNMNFDALFNFKDLKLNDYMIGDPLFFSRWDSENKLIKMGFSGKNGMTPVTGYFEPKRSKFMINAKFPKFDMVLIEPLLKDVLSNTKGTAAVDLTLTSGKKTPSLDGTIDIENYDVTVDFTKAEYSLSGHVDVKNSCFEARGLPLVDKLSGTGTMTEAYLRTDFFKNLRFGVNIDFKNLLALNTTIKNNDIFYGKAFGSGNFKITGNERSTNMIIAAETALSSEFYLPFTGISTIEEANFITFVDPFKKAEPVETHRNLLRRNRENVVTYTNDLDIKIALHVLPNTKAQISMVSDFVGNQIIGRGNGNFTMHINPNQEVFTMNGSYDITRGEYRFTLGTIFDKLLTIASGSSVNWMGDPADPDVNINASYKVKTSLEPLGYATNATLNCGINLVGKLFAPQMLLSITAPSADPEMQNALRNVLNTDEAVSNQFFSLFLASTLMPDTGAASMGSMGGSLAGATGFEFLSNQLSNLISSDRLNFKVGYRPRTEYSSDEFNIDFETEIIPNKLSIELGGNYNTGNNPTYTQRSPFAGDAYLTWTINKPGTLKLKGFTRVIERFDETQGLQESGIGVYFRQSFQTFDELRHKWKLWQESIKVKKNERKINKLKNEN